MRRVTDWAAFGGGKMSNRLAAGVLCDWLGCAWVDMGAGVCGCKMSDIWDAPGLMSDILGAMVSGAS